MFPIALVLMSYLLGSLSFAVLVSRWLGLPDPRSYGSHNPGATNVLRTGQKKAAALTLLGDCLKAVFALLIIRALATWSPWIAPQWVQLTLAGAGLTVVLGHMWPVFFRFQGGKGVATALGVLACFHWALALVTLASWLLVAKISKISSLAALTAAVLAPLYTIIGWKMGWMSTPIVWSVTCISLLLIHRHRSNIIKLLAGAEGHIGQPAAEASLHEATTLQAPASKQPPQI